MFWRARGINILPNLDDFLFLIMGYDDGCLLAKIVEEDMRRAGLAINQFKSDGTPNHDRVHLGLDVDLASGLFTVPIARWEALRADAVAIHNSKGTRVQARKLACLVGTIISMKFARGPITQYILGTCTTYSIMSPHSTIGQLSMTKPTSSYCFGEIFLASVSNQIFGLAPKGYPSR